MYFTRYQKAGDEMFWIVRGSNVERSGPILVNADAVRCQVQRDQANEKRSLVHALASTATSTVAGKTIQVSNSNEYSVSFCFVENYKLLYFVIYNYLAELHVSRLTCLLCFSSASNIKQHLQNCNIWVKKSVKIN